MEKNSDKLYRHAQPAPGVPPELTEDMEMEYFLRDDWKGTFRGGWEACRAAMLQAEHVTTDNKLPFEQWLSQQTGAIDVECGCVMTEVFFHWLRVAYEAGNSPVIGIDPASGPDRAVEVRYVAPPGYVMVPKVPSQAHLNSIAMRYRHDFYLLNDAQKDNALATARQMYEECSAQGFYTLPAAPQEMMKDEANNLSQK